MERKKVDKDKEAQKTTTDNVLFVFGRYLGKIILAVPNAAVPFC